jgi:hypothetical protein
MIKSPMKIEVYICNATCNGCPTCKTRLKQSLKSEYCEDSSSSDLNDNNEGDNSQDF